jgi:hypothetical protein
MFLDVDTAENFIKMLESEGDKDIPMFVGQLTQIDARGISNSFVVVQYQYDHGMVIRFKEHVGSAWLPRDNNDVQASTSADELNKKIENKKAVIIGLLTSKGFTKIVPGIWMAQ